MCVRGNVEVALHFEEELKKKEKEPGPQAEWAVLED